MYVDCVFLCCKYVDWRDGFFGWTFMIGVQMLLSVLFIYLNPSVILGTTCIRKWPIARPLRAYLCAYSFSVTLVPRSMPRRCCGHVACVAMVTASLAPHSRCRWLTALWPERPLNISWNGMFMYELASSAGAHFMVIWRFPNYCEDLTRCVWHSIIL